MGLNKFDERSDGIADLYRAALYLTRGRSETGLRFLNQARKKIGRELPTPFLPEISADKLKTRRDQLFWAEKVLDCYLGLKNLAKIDGLFFKLLFD